MAPVALENLQALRTAFFEYRPNWLAPNLSSGSSVSTELPRRGVFPETELPEMPILGISEDQNEGCSCGRINWVTLRARPG